MVPVMKATVGVDGDGGGSVVVRMLVSVVAYLDGDASLSIGEMRGGDCTLSRHSFNL